MTYTQPTHEPHMSRGRHFQVAAGKEETSRHSELDGEEQWRGLIIYYATRRPARKDLPSGLMITGTKKYLFSYLALACVPRFLTVFNGNQGGGASRFGIYGKPTCPCPPNCVSLTERAATTAGPHFSGLDGERERLIRPLFCQGGWRGKSSAAC